jgi:hypothetical protein
LLVPTPSDSWSGTNPTLTVAETLRGLQPVSGTFRLGFKGHRTQALPHDASAATVEAALEALHTLSDVAVSRHANGFGFNWLVTFVSDYGPQPLLVSHGAQLTGPSAAVYASRETVGVLPADYGATAGVPASRTDYQIVGLANGRPYYVTVRASNDQGLGPPAVPNPPRLAPVAAPGPPRHVEILPLTDLSLKVVWAAPLDDGGLPVVTYRVEWDTAAGFPAIGTSGYAADVSVRDPASFAHCNGLFYFNLPVTHASAWMPRFARVRASNAFASGPNADASGPATPTLRAPGSVQAPTLVATSGVGLLVEWQPPSAELAQYGGDGGSAVTEYLVEYDRDPHFDGPATEVTVRMPHPYALLIGGRELMTGEESRALEAGVAYYVRVTAFNGVGYGPASVTSPPMLDPQDQLPTQPTMGASRTVDARTVHAFFEPPPRDGGEPLTRFRVDYDVDVRGIAAGQGWGSVNGTTFEPRGGFVELPVVRALQAVELKAAELVSEEQWVVASVAVTNERQTIRTNVTGVDEVQLITVMADEVIDTVMTVSTTASDYNEEQTITIDATDLNEVQTFRTAIAAVLEAQTLTVSATRLNEVQQVAIELTGDTSDAAAVLALEASLGGSFQLKLDTRGCEWCATQSSRTSGSIDAPFTAARLNASLAALPNLGAGSVAVTKDVVVVRSAAMGGVLLLKFNVTFEGDGVRGDLAQMVVATNQLTNTSQGVYVTDLAVTTLVGGNQPAGSFYLTYHCESRTVPVSVEATQGSKTAVFRHNATNVTVGDVVRVNVGTSQPRLGAQGGGASYAYYAVAAVRIAADGTVTVTLDKAFADASSTYEGDAGKFYSNATDTYGVSEACYGADPETTLRIDHNASADYLREKLEALSTIPSGGGIEVTRRAIPAGNSRNFGVETGSNSGSVEVVGYDYNITFVNNNGDLHDLFCEQGNAQLRSGAYPYEATNDVLNSQASPRGKQCSVSEWTDAPHTDGVFLDGSFTLSLPFPHFQQAYDQTNGAGGVQENFTTAAMRFDASAAEVEAAMEDVVDRRSDTRVFGSVAVTRAPYQPSADSKWSGQYLWAVTFLTRPGNVPTSVPGLANLFGTAGNLSLAANLTVGSGLHPLQVDAPGVEAEGNEVGGSFGLDWRDSVTGAVTSTNCTTFLPWLTGDDMAHALNAAFFGVGTLQAQFLNGSRFFKLLRYSNDNAAGSARDALLLQVNHWVRVYDGLGEARFYRVRGVDDASQTVEVDREVVVSAELADTVQSQVHWASLA